MLLVGCLIRELLFRNFCTGNPMWGNYNEITPNKVNLRTSSSPPKDPELIECKEREDKKLICGSNKNLFIHYLEKDSLCTIFITLNTITVHTIKQLNESYCYLDIRVSENGSSGKNLVCSESKKKNI